MSIKSQIKSGVKDKLSEFLESVVQESSTPQVDRFIQVRALNTFRIKILMKGINRVIYVQTDRREFIKASFAGRRLTEVERFNSLPEIEEDTRATTADGYRIVTTQDYALPIVRAALSGLRRRTTGLSNDEVVVIAMLQYVNQSVVTDVEQEEGDEEFAPVDQYELQSMGRGWMVVRPVS